MQGLTAGRSRYFLKHHLLALLTHQDNSILNSSFFKKYIQIHYDSVHLKKREVPCPHCQYRAANVFIMNGHIKRRHGGVGLLPTKSEMRTYAASEVGSTSSYTGGGDNN